ncbi:MAG: hypothetical protein ACRET2_07385 [Steroidobacteraceae bacterium]
MHEPSAGRLVRRGRCHVLGDDIALDGGIIPQRFAAQRVTDPAALTPHLFESVDPDFVRRVSRGDIVLAGSHFAGGKPRLQGFIAMAALDLAVVCVSMPYKMLRRAVAHAIPVIVGAAGPRSLAVTGDEIEVDFSAGVLRNLTRGGEARVPAMPPVLRDIVAGGGMRAALEAWLALHPEQATQQE